MDPETVVLVGAGTGDMKMLNIGLCMQMSDYKTCIQQALTLSCSLNQRESVLKLISAGSHPTNCDLSAASRNGHYDLVKTLLALPGAQYDTSTACYVAQHNGYHDIVNLLSSNLPADYSLQSGKDEGMLRGSSA